MGVDKTIIGIQDGYHPGFGTRRPTTLFKLRSASELLYIETSIDSAISISSKFFKCDEKDFVR